MLVSRSPFRERSPGRLDKPVPANTWSARPRHRLLVAAVPDALEWPGELADGRVAALAAGAATARTRRRVGKVFLDARTDVAMSLAAETREAVRTRPFLLEGLRAGVVNYAAAARALEVADDTEAVATALRRFAERLPERSVAERRARVTMHGGLSTDAESPLLTVGEVGVGEADGDGGASLTGVLATGDVDAAALAHALGVLTANGVDVEAAGVAGESLVVVVDRRDGPAALRGVEAALEAVPAETTL